MTEHASGNACILGIEGGGTRTTAILVDSNDQLISEFSGGSANFQLLTSAEMEMRLLEVRDHMPAVPDRIGIGLAGVRSVADHRRLTTLVERVWPGVPCATSDDLLCALEATSWPDDCPAQVLTVCGTGSCTLGRHRRGDGVKVGGRGHILGDRASACEIAQKTLRRCMTIFDIDGEWPPLGADILTFLQMNEPEDLIDWSIVATKAELASVAIVTFRAAVARQDEIAVSILDDAAERLASDTLHCADRIATEDERVQFVFNGSVLLKNPSFMADVTSRLQKARPGSTVTPLSTSSVYGTIALARSLPSDEAPEDAVPTPPSTGIATWKPVASSPTEGRHPLSTNLSTLPISEAIALQLNDDATIPGKVLEQAVHIEWTVRRVVRAFAEGGRLIYTGAGTSGRLGVLDASECPPTFRSPGDLVQGIIAGGRSALWSAVEGAEDDAPAGERAIQYRKVNEQDVVIGISASGHAPFIWGCLNEAKRRGASTVLVCCNPGYRDHPLPDQTIIPDTGPEILTDSTRLKSGTATKLILNLITTLAMTHSGKVLSNLMIDLNPSNSKLRNRAVRIVCELTDSDEATARAGLEASGWVVRAACESIGMVR